jgi:hypothetical protein
LDVPVTIEEQHESPRLLGGERPGIERSYLITSPDTEDEGVIVDEFKALVPLLDPALNLPRETEPDMKQLTALFWVGTFRFRDPDQVENDTGESSFQFDTGGGSTHITHSKQTLNTYSAGTAPDFEGAINVSENAVEGTEITVPVYQFSETHWLDDAVVDGAYKAALFHATGKVNNAAFRGFEAGEVLFLGASGSKRGRGDWEITFRFAASPNVVTADNLMIGPLGPVEKKGWDYLWVRYQETEDATAEMVVRTPIAVYIEQVYDEVDFETIGIGT